MELRRSDREYFFRYMRMTPEGFDAVLEAIRPLLERSDRRRLPISPEERLAITLRFLATGDQVTSIARSFRMGVSTCHTCIYDTLDAIWTVLAPIHMPVPTEEMWRESEREFHHRWNFPNCIAALDGKHVNITCPRNTGSMYYNYKGRFSTVLLAAVDAFYRFSWVSVGSAGRESDSAIFTASDLGRRLASGRLSVPGPQVLPGTDIEAPHVMVGDEAFPLKCNIMRPFPGAQLSQPDRMVFNYRLSRARRIVENAFGIMVQRFRCFLKPLHMEPKNAVRVIRAACVLHNLLRQDAMGGQGCRPQQDDVAPLSTSGAFQPLHEQIGSNNHQVAAAHWREVFCTYFSNDGAVPWQNAYAGVRE